MSRAQIERFASLVVAFTDLEHTVRKYVNSSDVRLDFMAVKLDLANLRDTLHEPTKPMPTLKELFEALGDTEVCGDKLTAFLAPKAEDPTLVPTPETTAPIDPAPAPAPETPAPTPEPAPVPA